MVWICVDVCDCMAPTSVYVGVCRIKSLKVIRCNRLISVCVCVSAINKHIMLQLCVSVLQFYIHVHILAFYFLLCV